MKIKREDDDEYSSLLSGRYPPDLYQDESTSCLSQIKAEFRWRNFGLGYFNEEVFYTSQWRWPPLVFVLYRLVAAGYAITWIMITTIRYQEAEAPWPVWLTNWAYLLLTVHLTLSATISLLYTANGNHPCCTRENRQPRSRYNSTYFESSRDDTSGGANSSNDDDVQVVNPPASNPWFVKLDWVIFNTVAVFAFIVTIVYFTTLYPYLSPDTRFPPMIDDLNLHAVNSLLVVLEMIMSAIPIRLLHIVYPLVFGLAYTLFSVAYWAVDHKNVLYPRVLDWNHPGYTMGFLIFLTIIGIPLLQLMLFAMYKLRVFIYNKIYSM